MISYININKKLYLVFPQEVLFLFSSILIVVLLFKGNLSKKIMVGILCYNFGTAISFIPLSIVNYIVKFYEASTALSLYFISDILSYIFNAIVLEFIGYKFQKLQGAIPNGCSIYLTCLSFFLSQSCIFLTITTWEQLERAESYSFLAAFFFTIYAATSVALTVLAIYYIDKRLAMMVLEKLYTSETRHFKALEQGHRQTAAFRHDVNNHLICLKNLLNSERYSEAQNYLESMVSTVQALSPTISTGNVYTDAILQEKYNLAKSDGISMDIDMVFPQTFVADPMDICIILSNALDNALEACHNITDPTIQKYILATAFVRRAYLVIEIKNSSQQPPRRLNDKWMTNKSDSTNHGIGMENIMAAIHRSHGTADFSPSDQEFRFSSMIPLE